MKKLQLQFFIGSIICFGLGISFGFVATAIGDRSIERFDTPIISFIQGMEMPWLTPVMKAFTWIGSMYFVVPFTLIAFILLFFIYQKRHLAFLVVTVMAGTILLNRLLKDYFNRERPEIHRIMDVTGFSFPSNHAMMALSLYTIIAYIVWRKVKSTRNRVFLVLFTAFMISIISISRIYLGVHYPSDIVGGLAASGLWVIIVIVIYGIFQNRRENKKSREYI